MHCVWCTHACTATEHTNILLLVIAACPPHFLGPCFTCLLWVQYGFGANKRIVLYDTLLSQCSQGEVVAVLAHELGHW